MGKAPQERNRTRKRATDRLRPTATPADLPPGDPRGRLKTGLIVLAMLLAVLSIYVPIPSASGQNALWGADFYELHLFRIRFAQAGLFGPHPHLPAWYPRELLGTPFWSNIQSFPFLPTRLLLLGLDPLTLFPVAVILAAALSALFTFLYARRVGLSRPAAALAGWTFACAGFFASRVMAGHLPLLEAYPALPLLLWLIERFRDAHTGRERSIALATIGLACACIALAGHPQLPLYAGISAALYALVRIRGKGGWQAVAAMAAGAGCAAFVMWPMLLLVERSNRVLALGPAATDISFPYSRLIAFILPWAQGWPASVQRTPQMAVAFPNDAYFWDTVCYIGWLPLVACVFLLSRTIAQGRRPKAPWTFIALLSIGGLLLALPAARLPLLHTSGTILRSPARLLYFTAFGLAIGLGVALDVAIERATGGRRWRLLPIAFVLVAFHLFDLGRHDRYFIRMLTYRQTLQPMDEQIAQYVDEGRVAIDYDLPTPLNRELDDIGMFDSIALAKPYLAILDLSDLPPKTNTQYIDGSDLTPHTLAECGVRFVVTNKTPGGAAPVIHGFQIRDPAPRVQYYPDDDVRWLDVATTHKNLRNPEFDLRHWLMLPSGSKPGAVVDARLSAARSPAEIRYVRDAEDQFTTDVKTGQPGYLCWLDAWDPGWHATLDGTPAAVLPAQDVFMAVRVPSGAHTVRLTFATPGARTGALLSLGSVLVLAMIACLPLLRSGTESET